ncbi:hypothetical protein D9M70_563490 [compost metagenome]
MAHRPHAVAHDDAHGGIEDRLASLFAALAAGLAALVFHAFGDRAGYAGGTVTAGRLVQDRKPSELTQSEVLTIYPANQCGIWRDCRSVDP